MTSTHHIIPSAVMEYCEAIRQSRIRRFKQYQRGSVSQFEAVILAACKPAKPEPVTIKDVTTAHIVKVVNQCGGKVLKAAKVLGRSSSSVYEHLRKVAT